MAVHRHLVDHLAARIMSAAPLAGGLVVGLTGPQGSGKTPLAAELQERLTGEDLHVTILALDDLYLPRAERLRLAAEAHPLFATRGVPGTHDAALGARLLTELRNPGQTLVPSFDKGADDRRARWIPLEGPFDVVLFEGWCVGARPQTAGALAAPINALERERDPSGLWRRAVNEALAGPYQALFAEISLQVLLRPPSFDVVLGWRRQQERELIARGGQGQSDAGLAAFVQHYERLSRWIDAEMPARADVVVRLGPQREALEVKG